MARIDELAIERIGTDALTEALALTVEANWNQTADDWAFFFVHGTVFGARDAAGKVVATAALLPYSGGFAWISLVIVAKVHRGQGLGTRMLSECLAVLRERDLVGMLDATQAGSRIYGPLGFKPILGLKRWEGMGNTAPVRADPGHIDTLQPLGTSGIERVARFDAAAFGTKRDALLADLCTRAGTCGFELDGRNGYALMRRGRVAAQLGPVVAANENDALILLDAAIASTAGSVFVDVPDAWIGIATRLGARGFRVQRPFLRMALGRNIPYGDPPQVFAIAGPEYG
jgi:GNAT superfamily N-acetyltransferase